MRSTSSAPAGVLGRIAAGAVAGLAGSCAMTLVQLGWRAQRRQTPLAPQTITDAALFAVGVEQPPPALRQVSAAAAHAAVGTSAGALYAVVTAAVPGGRGSGALIGAATGAAYGILLWTVNYFTWIPAFGLVPPPGADDSDRQARLVAGHLVYGVVTGALVAAAGDD